MASSYSNPRMEKLLVLFPGKPVIEPMPPLQSSGEINFFYPLDIAGDVLSLSGKIINWLKFTKIKTFPLT